MRTGQARARRRLVHDEADGCDPILPADPCPAGQLALPGETACREVAPCGTGDYGAIPTDGTTQYVNAAYTGGSNDGTIDRPWTTVSDAYAAASAGAIVAIAAGSYPGSVNIHDKPVKLWGRCPSMVHLEGQDGVPSSAYILSGASGTEIHRLSITGPGAGLVITGAEQVLLEQVWIHDNETTGLQAHTLSGPASVTVRDSLFESNVAQGAYAWAATLTIEDSVIRDSLQDGSGASSSGLATACNDAGDSATLSVSHSLIERNISAGILANCADLSVSDTVIRDQVVDPNGQAIAIDLKSAEGTAPSTLTLRSSALLDNNNIGVGLRGVIGTIENTVIRRTGPRPGSGGGHGINIRDEELSGVRSDLTVRTSVVEDNNGIGILVYGSDAEVVDSVVRGTKPNSAGFGVGVQLEQRPDDGARSTATVRRSVVEGSSAIGLYATGSDLTVDATVVRDTVIGRDFSGGGLYAAANLGDSGRTTLTVTRSLVDHNADTNVTIWGADATFIESVVQDSQTGDFGKRGQGISVYDSERAGARATLTILGTLIERSQTFAIATSGEDTLLDGVVVRDTRSPPLGSSGFGIVFVNEAEPGTPVHALVRNTLVDQSLDLGIFAFGADITIEGCAVTNTAPADNGMYGDGICINSSADYPTIATITDTTVTESARAAILNLGSQVAIGRSLLLCQAFDMDGEDWDTPFQFEDLGGNGCGCPAAVEPCQVLSATLRPPEAEEPPDEKAPPPSGD